MSNFHHGLCPLSSTRTACGHSTSSWNGDPTTSHPHHLLHQCELILTLNIKSVDFTQFLQIKAVALGACVETKHCQSVCGHGILFVLVLLTTILPSPCFLKHWQLYSCCGPELANVNTLQPIPPLSHLHIFISSPFIMSAFNFNTPFLIYLCPFQISDAYTLQVHCVPSLSYLIFPPIPCSHFLHHIWCHLHISASNDFLLIQIWITTHHFK